MQQPLRKIREHTYYDKNRPCFICNTNFAQSLYCKALPYKCCRGLDYPKCIYVSQAKRAPFQGHSHCLACTYTVCQLNKRSHLVSDPQLCRPTFFLPGRKTVDRSRTGNFGSKYLLPTFHLAVTTSPNSATYQVGLASFPGSPRAERTASDGKLGRAWERGYKWDLICECVYKHRDSDGASWCWSFLHNDP